MTPVGVQGALNPLQLPQGSNLSLPALLPTEQAPLDAAHLQGSADHAATLSAHTDQQRTPEHADHSLSLGLPKHTGQASVKPASLSDKNGAPATQASPAGLDAREQLLGNSDARQDSSLPDDRNTDEQAAAKGRSLFDADGSVSRPEAVIGEPSNSSHDLRDVAGQARSGFSPFGVAHSDAARKASIDAIQKAVNAFVSKAESIQSAAEFPGETVSVRVDKISGSLLNNAWGQNSGIGIFPSALDFSAVEPSRRAGASPAFHAGDIPQPVEIHVRSSITGTASSLWPVHQALDSLRKEIYEEYGVHIVLAEPRSTSAGFSLPRASVIGNALREHFDIARMIDEVGGHTQITSRDFKWVEDDLGYKESDISALAGKDFLTVGEGASDFGKHLESLGVRVTAADWWYGLTPQQIDRYLRIEKGNGRGDGTMSAAAALDNLPRRRLAGKLPNLPVPDASFDETACNQLIYWLDLKDPALADASLRDMLRVTRPGGRVRIGQVRSPVYERFIAILKSERPAARIRHDASNDTLIIDLPRQRALPKP